MLTGHHISPRPIAQSRAPLFQPLRLLLLLFLLLAGAISNQAQANKEFRCASCGNQGRAYWPTMDEFLENVEHYVRTFDINDPQKGKKFYNWMKGLNDKGEEMSRNLPIMHEMNQTLRYLKNNPDINPSKLVGFGKEIGNTGRYTDILQDGTPKYIELKSVMGGVDDIGEDGLNMLSGLSSSPLKNRPQFVDQFINGYIKDIRSLDELIYVFDAKKLGVNGEAFIKKQFKELFETKGDEIFNAMSLEVKQQLGITIGNEKAKLNELINDTNSALYKFIKIE